MKRLISLLLALCIMPFCLSPQTKAASLYSGAYIEFGEKNSASLLSVMESVQEEGADARIEKIEFQGEKCAYFNAIAKRIYVKLDKSYFEPTAREALIKIKYFDVGKDTIRFEYNSTNEKLANKGVNRRIFIQKQGTNTWQTAVFVINDAKFDGGRADGTDFYICSHDNHQTYGVEYIKSIEVVNLEKYRKGEMSKAPIKANLIHHLEAYGLFTMGLFQSAGGVNFLPYLELPIYAEDVRKPFTKMVGDTNVLQDADEDQVLKYGDLLKSAIQALGYQVEEDLLAQLEGLGMLYDCNTQLSTFFGKIPFRMNNTGLTKQATVNLDRNAYRDDLAGVLYSMLYAKPKGQEKPLIQILVENKIVKKQDVLSTGDKVLINFFLMHAGFELEEKSYIDAKTGRKVNMVGLDGTNTTHMYFTAQSWSSDSNEYVVNANVDKYGRNTIFASYNTTDKTTSVIDDSYNAFYYEGTATKDSNEFFYTIGADIY